MGSIDYALLKVSRSQPLLPLYQYLDYTNTLENNLWGTATITGISGKSNGTAILTFPDLTGVTITSYSSDIGTPIIVGNDITFPTGSYWDIVLSDGTFIPDPNSGYNVAATGSDAVSTGFTKDINAAGSLYFNTYGYNRDVFDKMVPASQANTGFDVLGNPLVYNAIPGGLNLADGVIDYNLVVNNDIYNKNAVQGNILGLPEIWLSGTTWVYNTDPLTWVPTEKTMEFLYSRLTEEYKKIIFTTMLLDDTTLLGIIKEEIFTEQLSDQDAEILNQKNNGINTIP